MLISLSGILSRESRVYGQFKMARKRAVRDN
jgi:hypothetical protein